MKSRKSGLNISAIKAYVFGWQRHSCSSLGGIQGRLFSLTAKPSCTFCMGEGTPTHNQPIGVDYEMNGRLYFYLSHFFFCILHFHAAFGFVTFFWRPKESNQRKGSADAAVPKIALHSVAQNKLALRLMPLLGVFDCLAVLFCLGFLVGLKQYSVRPLHSGQFFNGPSAKAEASLEAFVAD